jgi:hypothetical protein
MTLDGPPTPLREGSLLVAVVAPGCAQSKERAMSDVMKRLEERIRRLNNDIQSRNDWRKVRIEIEKRGGRWEAENGIIFELRDGVIYQFISDYREGVSQTVVTGVDAPVPFVAELDMDLQGTPPDRRAALVQELMSTAARATARKAKIVVIVPGDWLTKISKARWGSLDWMKHLKPTQMTLDARKAKGKRFDPHWIYPGDTFEVMR